MKTAYCISPGLQLPGDSFTWRAVPVIISQPMLWEAMRGMSSGLVFRVRTEKNVGDRIDGNDRLESCVGVIDSTVRWRACFAMVRSALAAVRTPEIAEPCWNVYGLMTTRNPATVAMTERQQLAGQLKMAIDKLPQDDPRAVYEACAGMMCLRLVFCDNDGEAAHSVPYGPLYAVNAGEWVEDRESTVEVMASSVFLAEAGNRMAEKVGDWLWSPLPAIPGAPVAPPKAPDAPEELVEDEAG